MRSIILTLLTLITFSSFGQKEESYFIKGHVEGLKDTTVNLANYFGNKLYYNDTTYIDSKGDFQFRDKLRSEGGKYAVVFPGPKYFDIIVGDDDIEFSTDLKDLVGTLNFTESDNNQIFLDYIQFINERMKNRKQYEDCLADSLKSEEEHEICREFIRELNEEVVNKQQSIIKKHPKLLVSKMIKMTTDVIIPEELPSDYLAGEEEKRRRYLWYKDHYWDNTDLTDDRLVKDQSFDRVLDKFVTQVVPQIPDSMEVEAHRLIERIRGNKDMFKYIVHKFTFHTESSKVMCMDQAFVNMIDTYYKTGQVDWLDEVKMLEIIDAADDKRATLCGQIAPNIILPDTTGKNWVNLHEVKSEYTALVIWEASCGHCKKEMPKLKEIADLWEGTLTVVAVGNEQENEDWIKFIREKKLDGWIHISDNTEISTPDSARTLIRNGITTLESLNFRPTYNIKSTPQIFLLDENKEILAKQLTSEQIDDFLKHLTGVEEKPDNIPEIIQEGNSSPEKSKRDKSKARKD